MLLLSELQERQISAVRLKGFVRRIPKFSLEML